jgi:hypothetical protein
MGGGPGQARRGGRIVDRRPAEVAQLDDPDGDRVLGGEPGERRIQGEQRFVPGPGTAGRSGNSARRRRPPCSSVRFRRAASGRRVTSAGTRPYWILDETVKDHPFVWRFFPSPLRSPGMPAEA